MPPQSPKLLKWPLPLALVWLLVPIAGVVIINAVAPIPPNDYWWSLVMGRFVEARAAIPRSNLFLYTLPADAPFFNQPWMAQWAMYRLFELGGHAASIVAHGVTLAITWTTLVALSLRRSRDPRVVGAAALVLVALCNNVFSPRTQMFGFVLYAPFVYVLLGVADGWLSRRWIAAAIVMVALWANVHGSFALAPVLVAGVGGAVCVERYLREHSLEPGRLAVWAAFVLGCAVAPVLNPRGVEVYQYVVHLTFFSTVPQSSSEWQPLLVGEPLGAFYAVCVGLSIVVLAVRRSEVALHEVVLFAAAVYLGSSSRRSLFWFSSIALVCVVPHVRALLAGLSSFEETSETSTPQGVLNAVLVGTALLGAILVQPGCPGFAPVNRAALGYAARRLPPHRGVLSHAHASWVLERLGARQPPGRLFHDQALGGQVEYALAEPGGEPVAFVDQRFTLIDDEIWEDYFHCSGGGARWEEIFARHEIRTALVSPVEQWPLLQALQRHRDWHFVRADHGHLLFVHESARAPVERSFDGVEDPAKHRRTQ